MLFEVLEKVDKFLKSSNLIESWNINLEFDPSVVSTYSLCFIKFEQ